MPGLKERAKTIPQILDMASFILADRPFAPDAAGAPASSPSVPPGMLEKLTSRLQNASWTARRSGSGRARLRRRGRAGPRQGRPAAPGRAFRPNGLPGRLRHDGNPRPRGNPCPPRATAPDTVPSADLTPASRGTARGDAWQPQPRSDHKGMTHDQPGPPHRQARHRRQDHRAADLQRHHRPRRHRHPPPLLRRRRLHLRPRLHLDRLLRERDHLHRRRQGRAALPRLPDRAARREVELPRGLLPAALRRAADRRRSSRTSSAA